MINSDHFSDEIKEIILENKSEENSSMFRN